MVCTFFGHNDTPDGVESLVRSAVIDLIIKKGVTKFYVGSQGNFDRVVKRVLRNVKQQFPYIECLIVLAYMPAKCGVYADDVFETVYPEGLESVPLRAAIARRNEWMVQMADVVVTYVKYNIGGASKYKLLAEKRKKEVINIADF